MRQELRDEFEDRDWGHGGRNPRSGRGSSLRWTRGIRDALPRLFATYKVRTFLDAPCGDWHWMQHVDLTGIDYIGADISQGLLDGVAAAHARDGVLFRHLDITSDPLPAADLMMCRDCLFHLNFEMRWAVYENFARSGIPYLLSTVNYNAVNEDLAGPGWKPHNPFLAPFTIGAPLELIQERGKTALPADWREATSHPDAERFRAMAIWSRDRIVEMLAGREAAHG